MFSSNLSNISAISWRFTIVHEYWFFYLYC